MRVSGRALSISCVTVWMRRDDMVALVLTIDCGDRTAVVDSKLKVYGVDGLRIVDASVMPSVVSGNLQASIYMIGEKGADMIAAGK